MELTDVRGNRYDLSQSGRFVDHYHSDSSCAKIILDQINSGNFYDFIKKQEFSSIIDLGANVGLFSLFVNPIADKVYAVEPTPSHFYLMRELVALTNVHNIECHNVAVSNENGFANFYIHDRNSTMNSFVKHQTDPHVGETVSVKTVKLATFIDSIGLDRVSFVKMDIEGFENQIILDSSFEEANQKVDSFYIEVHDFTESGMMAHNFNLIRDKFMSFGRVVEKLAEDAMFVYG